jgi:hypothetical protein
MRSSLQGPSLLCLSSNARLEGIIDVVGGLHDECFPRLQCRQRQDTVEAVHGTRLISHPMDAMLIIAVPLQPSSVSKMVSIR